MALSPQLSEQPHHDGSSLYVSTPAPQLGEAVDVWLRIPKEVRATAVHVRSAPDGEPVFASAQLDRERTGRAIAGYGAGDQWWRAQVVVRNPITHYRFLVESDAAEKFWVTATGVSTADLPDTTDFRLVAEQAPPAWTDEAIVYEIFPDRFARSVTAGPLEADELPEWATACEWDTDEVIGRGERTPGQIFGGDLDGIAEHLDHIAALGADTIYVRPVFPAGSCHRYDAAGFDRVDDILGGDIALERLAKAVHERGMRLIGDITTNHCGDRHEWFRTAQQDPAAPEREMFYFDDDGSYESWYGVPTLPKLDWRSPLVVDRMTATVRRWLQYYDGWRVDVANMTGRCGAVDVNHDVARHLAEQIRAERPDAMLIGEHNHDAGPDLDRGGWQGAMNYAGFTRPLWTWLRGPELESADFMGEPGGVPRRGGVDVVRAIRQSAAGMSWRSLVHSWQLLDSFDVARMRTVTGSREAHLVAVGLQATLPGTPMICAGSEFGLEGGWGEDARTPMPWNRPGDRDQPTWDAHLELFGTRRREPALRHGGLRWLYVDDDTLVFLRETATEAILVAAGRDAAPSIELSLDADLVPVHQASAIDADAGRVRLPATDGALLRMWRVGGTARHD
ncbi:MAG TPA: glycoside hydrolase family 13 protein [Flexivirga sp.]|uniref:glycoside hydrolase family 13 protein n=1 Tax=Flexivirga sp. TaxID=1962927 RepID=UPI002CC2B9C9|nr:glycoside hydrolase family 13 protein [Flexivirga sp.]HWC21451.1 glycoside hydrolase family 13 protein [Flexivirga sp.]